MLSVVTGFHYGKNTFKDIDNDQHLWLSLRPFHWTLDNVALLDQRKKHYFQGQWLKVNNIFTVKDTPQNNAVLIVMISDNDAAKDIVRNIPKRYQPLKPVLRPRNPKLPKTKHLVQRFDKMIDFAKAHRAQRTNKDNVVVWIKQGKKSNYKFDHR